MRLVAGSGMGGECLALGAAEERAKGDLGVEGEGEGELPLEPRTDTGV
jgi:hypothetical protein